MPKSYPPLPAPLRPTWRKIDADLLRKAELGRIVARLVEDYGLENVISALPKKLRGRPPSGNLLAFEKMDFAEWIDRRAAEYLGHLGAPVRQARIDAFHMEHGFDIEPSASQLDTIKKRHLKGRAVAGRGKKNSP